jgi:SEC-C motif domain protein
MLLNPLCPCGSQLNHTDCCGPYLSDKAVAPTAEALMRSRYSAYSKGHTDYLIQTQHPKTRKKDDRKVIAEGMKSSVWTGLTILKTQKGTATDHRGTVEFVALYRSGDLLAPESKQQIYQLHERSRFVKEDGKWFYVDGDILPSVKLKSITGSSD